MDPNGDGDPSDGIDGWRLDVVLDVAPPFWRDWYAHVKSINPNAITVAEIWERVQFDGNVSYDIVADFLDLLMDEGMVTK